MKRHYPKWTHRWATEKGCLTSGERTRPQRRVPAHSPENTDATVLGRVRDQRSAPQVGTGLENAVATLGTSWVVSLNTKHAAVTRPSNTPGGHLPQRNGNIHNENLHALVQSTSVPDVRRWEATPMP